MKCPSGETFLNGEMRVCADFGLKVKRHGGKLFSVGVGVGKKAMIAGVWG